MTPRYTFETVYPRYTFAPLVDFGMALSRLFLRARRDHGAKGAYPDPIATRAAH
ncbi:MAG: hypothetical protein ACE5DS_06670 [Kiloniellaceae bacterium]